jgi:protein XRP2
MGSLFSRCRLKHSTASPPEAQPAAGSGDLENAPPPPPPPPLAAVGEGLAAERAEDKLDPRDFIVSRRRDAVVVREPGQVRGQQFVVEECTGCAVVLLDHSAQVTVDLCSDCTFFVGPCEGSVFFRDCQRCRVVVAAQQLRLRDCKQLDMLVFVGAGQPSIESSSEIRLGCFQFAYFSLAAQFRAAGLSVWNSSWSDVHDFSARAGERHWDFLSEETDPLKLLALPPNFSARVPDSEFRLCESAVPLTRGSRPSPWPAAAAERVLVLALPPHGATEAAWALLAQLRPALRGGALALVRTREARLNKLQQAELFGKRKDVAALIAANAVVGLEIQGPAAAASVAAAASAVCTTLQAAPERVFFVPAPAESEVALARFFESFRPQI